MAEALVGEREVNVEIKAPAKMFYHMFAVTPKDLLRATPDNVHGCELDGGQFGKVGSTIVWNYVLDEQPKVATQRIEAVDPKKNLLVYRIIEGDPMKEFKSLLVTLKVTPKQRSSGSIVKWHIKYERIDDNVAHPEDLLAACLKISKDMDEMLLSQI